MVFSDVSPGDSLKLSAARHNAVNALLNGNPSDLSTGLPEAASRAFHRLTIKNAAGVDVPRGGVLGLKEPIFDADENEEGFAGNSIKLVGEKPKQSIHGDRFCIVTSIIAAGEVAQKAAILVGAVPARVDIRDEGHRHAQIVDDDVMKLESSDSGVPMIPAQAGTGEKWGIVLLGGGGVVGTTTNIERGRVVKRVDRPATIDDPADTTGPPFDQIPNPELWKNELPELTIQAEDAPAVSPSSQLPGPTWPFVDPSAIAQVGKPVIYGEASVVVYEAVPLPTLEEFLGHPPDPTNTPTDVFPNWWPPPWPTRYWERMQIDTSDPDPANHGPFPREIQDPDGALGEMIPNEAKFVKEYWSNPNLVCLLNNMWVTAINKEIQTASPTTFRAEPPSPGGPGGAP